MMLYSSRASLNGRSVAKSKSISAPGPSRPEEDEQIMDVDYDLGVQEHDEHVHGDEDHADDEEMRGRAGRTRSNSRIRSSFSSRHASRSRPVTPGA